MFGLFKNATSPLEIIRGPLKHHAAHLPVIKLKADRLTLAKHRWRGRANDGREFGFDLDRPLRDKDAFFETLTHSYGITQTPEPVLRVELAASGDAARIAWQVGNLHFPVMIGDTFLLVEDDVALRQMFERERIQFVSSSAVFQPLAGAAGHHHH